jgi:hypothetical protein
MIEYNILMALDLSKSYFGQSTVILHISTICYLMLLFISTKINILNIIFSSIYTIETLAKMAMEKRVYLSSYYSWIFIVYDIISGPVALGISIYYMYLGT